MILPTRPPAWPTGAKLALQISFGSAGFHVDGEDRLLETTIYHPAPSTLALRLAQPDTQVVYSEEFRNPCALYTTEDGSRYKVWYENEQSVLDKVALAGCSASQESPCGASATFRRTVPTTCGALC